MPVFPGEFSDTRWDHPNFHRVAELMRLGWWERLHVHKAGKEPEPHRDSGFGRR